MPNANSGSRSRDTSRNELEDTQERLQEVSEDDSADGAPSASARFRLEMDAFGRLVPRIVPAD